VQKKEGPQQAAPSKRGKQAIETAELGLEAITGEVFASLSNAWTPFTVTAPLTSKFYGGSPLTLESVPESAAVVARLKAELEKLQKDSERLAEEIKGKKKTEAATTQKIAELQSINEKIAKKLELAFLLARVSSQAALKLESDPEFAGRFLGSAPCKAFVVAVDIRRSTDLMLKARSAAHFAEFISALCTKLEAIVKESCGVFDKFTGDGILAFFPDFYIGKDAGFRAISMAQQCQDAFTSAYTRFRSSFTTVLNDVGLGIGIDYGEVNLLQVAGGLTVVGSPVVYACRLSNAPAGHIYVNQCAFEEVSARYGSSCYSNEVALEVKHEGAVLCYDVELTKRDFEPAIPDWMVPQAEPLKQEL